ncbi:hypothetical protein [Pectobacterium carotovorum]|uniref:hypothetical protein n=1 Tax=Pectobacterium carotovorum TaxID=554 RepID=UPI0006937DC3|nr:hypothetical protein [Pectobacterium carotovorum]
MGSKGSKKVTVGYRYYWDVQAGLGRGPINEIVAITADDKNVFAGSAGQISGNTSLYIDKAGLFGGDDTGGEGGIQGTFEVMMGGPTQEPTPALLRLLTGLVPGFRGLVTTLFSGLVSSYSASPKPWKYRVRRTDKGWDKEVVWYPEKISITLRNDDAQLNTNYLLNDNWPPIVLDEDGEPEPPLPGEPTRDEIRAEASEAIQDNLRIIGAMNPAHILIECGTNRDWGRGLSLADDFDLDSYKVAADRLYDEKFGLCFRYNRQDSLDTFVQQILDHIGAAQYGDLSTGKMTLKLIRDNYNPADLPLFTYDNGIIAVQDDDSTSTDSAPNEIVVTFRDPVTNTDGTVRAQNLGSIQSVGLISSSTEYKAIPTQGLAARVAQRDLEMGASGLTRLVIQFDRRGGSLAPASVFRVSLPDRNIANMVMRASKITEGENGALTITAVQDVFGLPATSYSNGNQGSEWTPPDQSLHAVSDVQLIEIPYMILVGTLSAAELDYLKAEAGYVGVLSTAPTPLSVNYQLQTRAAGAAFADRGLGDWTPSGILLSAMTRLTDSMHISLQRLPAIGTGIIVGNEIMRIDAVDAENNRLTVVRACADTLPVQHPAGTRVRFYTDAIESDNVEYITGETVEVRQLTRTSAEMLDVALAPVSTIVMNHRQSRPYLPGNIRINDALYPVSVAAAVSYSLTYAHRDRLLQADRLIDFTEGSIGPEPGVQYVITLTNVATGVVVWTNTTTDEAVTLPYSTETESEDAAAHILTLWSTRDGTESLYRCQAALPVGVYAPIPTPEPEGSL